MIGAVASAWMFTIGKSLISLYIGSSYGAAGSLIVVHLWIFYSAQIFLIGAEFTKVYADHYGSWVRQRPRSGASDRRPGP